MAAAGADRVGECRAAGFVPLAPPFLAGTMSHLVKSLILIGKILAFETRTVA
jgi:hypothetical protein